MSPVPSTLLPQQPHNVSYAARSTSALSSSCGMRQDVSVFESSKKEEWQRTQWSCGGGESSWKKWVRAVSMRGEGIISGGSEVGERWARVYACKVWGGTERTRLYKAVESVTSGSGSGSVSVVHELGGGVGKRGTGESVWEIEGEGECSCGLGSESGLRVKRLKTIVYGDLRLSGKKVQLVDNSEQRKDGRNDI